MPGDGAAGWGAGGGKSLAAARPPPSPVSAREAKRSGGASSLAALSPTARDLIRALLVTDPAARLGSAGGWQPPSPPAGSILGAEREREMARASAGAAAVMAHRFFREPDADSPHTKGMAQPGVDFGAIAARAGQTPWAPPAHPTKAPHDPEPAPTKAPLLAGSSGAGAGEEAAAGRRRAGERNVADTRYFPSALTRRPAELPPLGHPHKGGATPPFSAFRDLPSRDLYCE